MKVPRRLTDARDCPGHRADAVRQYHFETADVSRLKIMRRIGDVAPLIPDAGERPTRRRVYWAESNTRIIGLGGGLVFALMLLLVYLLIRWGHRLFG